MRDVPLGYNILLFAAGKEMTNKSLSYFVSMCVVECPGDDIAK